MSATRTDDRASWGPALRLSATAAATTWAAMLSWSGFTALPSLFLGLLIGVGAAIALIGSLGRWRRVPGAVVLLGQSLAAAMLVCLFVGDRPYPDATFWAGLDDAFTAARTYAAPVPSTSDVSVQPLLAIGGAVTMLLVDLLACTLRRVPLAGLPLLAVYSVPVTMLEGGLRWWVFALTAFGFLMLLFLQEQEQVGRWGRSLDAAGSVGLRSERVRGGALLVGLVATAAAVLLPTVIPTLDLQLLGVGSGPGGDDQITIENPLTDLRRDLRRGPDIPLVSIVTDDPSPDHLRISVLNRFSDNEFSSGDREVPADQVPDGPLPPLQGVSDAVQRSARSYSYQVSISSDFESRWLPTQAPISSIRAPGDWRYDSSTMDFLATPDDLDTAGISYEMTALDYDFRPEDLRAAPLPGDEVSEEVTDLPDSLPTLVSQLARGVTSGALSKYDKAVALQQWFREDGGFVYDIKDAPTAKVGTDELEAFLREDTGRVGYCEQFATAMAVMARVIGIPSRVAVGFLTPDATGPDTYVYSAWDLHAWPELYFPGAGWVLFDPTPARRVPDDELPAYTTRGTDVALPTVRPEPEPSRSPVQQPSVTDPDRPAPAPDRAADSAAGTGGGTGLPWARGLLVVAVLALLVLLALAPRTLRARQRGRRLAGEPEAGWEELRATSLDLAQSWPETRSPREVEAVVLTRLGRPGDPALRPARGPEQAPDAAEALGRIVLAVERSRYARGSTGDQGYRPADVLTCCEALCAGVSPRTRRRATWFPRSVVDRRPGVEPSSSAVGADDSDEVLTEHR